MGDNPNGCKGHVWFSRNTWHHQRWLTLRWRINGVIVLHSWLKRPQCALIWNLKLACGGGAAAKIERICILSELGLFISFDHNGKFAFVCICTWWLFFLLDLYLYLSYILCEIGFYFASCNYILVSVFSNNWNEASLYVELKIT